MMRKLVSYFFPMFAINIYAMGLELKPLTPAEYARWHVARMQRSTMPDALHRQLVTKVRLFSRHRRQVNVLSIGSGIGTPDVILARALARQTSIGHYQAIEPNIQHLEGLERSMQQIKALGATVRIAADRMEEVALDRKYDLIHLIHCMNWMADPVGLVDRLYEHLRPGGELWIILQSERGIPRLYSPMKLENQAGYLSIESLISALASRAYPHHLKYVQARIRVHEILAHTKKGWDVLSFLVNGNIHLLQDKTKFRLAKVLRKAARHDTQGAYIAEPFGFLVLRK